MFFLFEKQDNIGYEITVASQIFSKVVFTNNIIVILPNSFLDN